MRKGKSVCSLKNSNSNKSLKNNALYEIARECRRLHENAEECKRVHDGARDGTTFTCRAGGRIGLVGPPNSPSGLPAYSHGGAMLNEKSRHRIKLCNRFGTITHSQVQCVRKQSWIPLRNCVYQEG